jgi:hypothetical protein
MSHNDDKDNHCAGAHEKEAQGSNIAEETVLAHGIDH